MNAGNGDPAILGKKKKVPLPSEHQGWNIGKGGQGHGLATNLTRLAFGVTI